VSQMCRSSKKGSCWAQLPLCPAASFLLWLSLSLTPCYRMKLPLWWEPSTCWPSAIQTAVHAGQRITHHSQTHLG
jgi:hypothetical protein